MTYCNSYDVEKTLSTAFWAWFKQIPDKNQYLRELQDALIDLNCVDVVLARLNIDLIIDNTNNNITIKYGRRAPLPGMVDGDNFYEFEYVWKKQQSHSSFPDGLKKPIFNELQQRGYTLFDDYDKATGKLRYLYNARGFEENLLAWICYIIICENLKAKSELPVLLLPTQSLKALRDEH